MIDFREDVLPLKNKLFRLALRLTGVRADAEDIVQETLIKVWNKRAELDKIESVEAFSLTICRHLALDHLARFDNRHEALDDTTADTARDQAAWSPDHRPAPPHGESRCHSAGRGHGRGETIPC